MSSTRITTTFLVPPTNEIIATARSTCAEGPDHTITKEEKSAQVTLR